ncbi:16688_t:CDS:2, partial [Racocetra persica]
SHKENNDCQNSLEENDDRQDSLEENNNPDDYFSNEELSKPKCSKFTNKIKLNNTKSEVIVISDSESDITICEKEKQQMYEYSIKSQENKLDLLLKSMKKFD